MGEPTQMRNVSILVSAIFEYHQIIAAAAANEAADPPDDVKQQFRCLIPPLYVR